MFRTFQLAWWWEGVMTVARRSGFQPSSFDVRDFVFSEPEVLGDATPLVVPFVRDQGAVPCCVSMAVATCMEILDYSTPPFERLAPLFNYFVARGGIQELTVQPLIGKRAVSVTSFECVVEPDKTKTTNVASFAKDAGLLAEPGVNCFIPEDVKAKTASTQKLTLTLDVSPLAVECKTHCDADKTGGLPYRIPASVTATLTKGDSALLQKALLIPQFGAVRWLQASLNDSVDVKYDGETGALLSFSGKRAASTVDAAKLGEGPTSALAAIDAYQKKRAGAGTEADEAEVDEAEVDALERQVKRLEAQKKIETLTATE